MASPAIASERIPYAKLWQEFEQEIRRQVRECNLVADDALWTLLCAGDGSDRITIASAKRADDRIECSLDAALGFINCTLGRRPKSLTLGIRCLEGRLVDGDCVCTASQAASFVLDHLVGSEEV